MERADYERLRWRCIRRAFLELDIMLTRFLDNGFERLSPEQQQAFVELADMEDHELWYWVIRVIIFVISGCASPTIRVLESRNA